MKTSVLLKRAFGALRPKRFRSRWVCSVVVSVLCFVSATGAPAATSPSFPVAYNGLVFEEEAALPMHTGYFKLDVCRSGHFTGKLLLGKQHAGFSGRFNDSGTAHVHVWAATGEYELINNPDGSGDYREIKKLKWILVLQLTNGFNEVAGEIFPHERTGWSGIVQGQRAGYNARANPAPQVGRYTVTLPVGLDGQTGPAGDAWGTLTVSENGNVLLQGGLTDNSKFTTTSITSSEGAWPLFVPFDRGRGMLVGWLQFTNSSENELVGQLNWVRLRDPDSSFYPAGYTNQTSVLGSSYVRPDAQQSALNLTNAGLTLSGGGLPSRFTNSLVVSSPSFLKGSTDSPCLVKFSFQNGVFQGWTKVPGTGQFLPFSGVVLQNQNAGFGYFTGNSRSGQVTIQENP